MIDQMPCKHQMGFEDITLFRRGVRCRACGYVSATWAVSPKEALPSPDDPEAVEFFLNACADLPDNLGDGPTEDDYVRGFLRALAEWVVAK